MRRKRILTIMKGLGVMNRVINKTNFYILLLAIIFGSFIALLIVIESKVEYFTELPDYQLLEQEEPIYNNVIAEYTIEKGEVRYAYHVTGSISYYAHENIEEEIIVDDTDLRVGDIIKSGQYLDKNQTISADFNGLIVYIEEQENQKVLHIMSYQKMVVYAVVPQEALSFLSSNYELRAYINGEIVSLELMLIDYEEDSGNYQVLFRFSEETEASILPGMKTAIASIYEVRTNTLRVPKECYEFKDTAVIVRRGEEFFERVLRLKEGAEDYAEVIDSFFQEGDIILITRWSQWLS